MNSSMLSSNLVFRHEIGEITKASPVSFKSPFIVFIVFQFPLNVFEYIQLL